MSSIAEFLTDVTFGYIRRPREVDLSGLPAKEGEEATPAPTSSTNEAVVRQVAGEPTGMAGPAGSVSL